MVKIGELDLQRGFQQLGVYHGLLVLMILYHGDHVVGVIGIEFITIGEFLIGVQRSIILHIGNGIVIQCNGLIGTQFLRHTLVRLIIGIDRLGGETHHSIGKVVSSPEVEALLGHKELLHGVHLFPGLIGGLLVFESGR